MEILPISFIESLWPVRQSFPWSKAKAPDLIGTLVADLQRIQESYLQVQLGKVSVFNRDGTVASSEVDYSNYLQLGNSRIKALAASIVDRSDTDDEKAAKLLEWVKENVRYADDRVTYKADEYWALPTMTLSLKQGDCEDGAFLLASLMLNAGIDPDNVRVYGGFVSAGTNASTGGHAWVAYARETDDQWVALDWCYFPTDEAVSERTTLKADTKYQDDFFYVTATATVETPYTNSLRLPTGYQRALAQQPGQIFEVLA